MNTEKPLFQEFLSPAASLLLKTSAICSGIVCTLILISHNVQPHNKEQANQTQTIPQNTPVIIDSTDRSTAIISDSIYFVILQTFIDSSNADRYLTSVAIQFPESFIKKGNLGKRTCYRIAALQTNNPLKARKKRDELIATGTEAWVLGTTR